MTDTVKILGQSSPAVTTLTDLYVVPSLTQVVVSSIIICNRGAATTFRLSMAIAGAADAVSQYINYDTPIAPNDTIYLTLGAGLQTTDKIRCYAGAATLTFTATGLEIT